MTRLYAMVEGKSEQLFMERVISPHLIKAGVQAVAIQVATSRQSRRPDLATKGGVLSYHQTQRELGRLRSEHAGREVRFTSMIDYYALPDDFPGHEEARRLGSASAAVAALEQAWGQDVGDWRFIPYLQLHEFEALLLSDPERFESFYPDHKPAIRDLVAEVASCGNPEQIDDGVETAPSKRIAHHLPLYTRQKPTASSIVAQAIGLQTIRERCPHFAEWLTQLESLGESS